MVLPSRQLSLAGAWCLALVQTTHPCGILPMHSAALPSLLETERIPLDESGHTAEVPACSSSLLWGLSLAEANQ